MRYDPTDETRYRLLKYLEEHPTSTQRQVAHALNVSIGKANYCLKALVEKGWVKVRNFRNSNNKSAYLYVLTPRGIEEKIDVTRAFLRRTRDEYDRLAKEIEHLADEVSRFQTAPKRSA
jgi:EPS-associated MarR family transcriptional regulator